MVTISTEAYQKIIEKRETERAKRLGITHESISIEKLKKLCISDKDSQELVIYGRIPSKKNSKRIAWRGRPMLLSSESYIEWEKKTIEKIEGFKLILKPPYRISVKFWFPDNRKADCSNKFESLADMLVEANVLPDDNWKVLSHIELIAMGVDKKKPRAEIMVTSLKHEKE